MSRLDSFIRRMQAQRACLDEVARLIAGVPGPVLELGLGNGRTYDHLRGLMPEREIYCFDYEIKCNPACIPPADYLVLGDARETLALFDVVTPQKAAFVHNDFGVGHEIGRRVLSAWLSPLLPQRTAPGGIVASSDPLALSEGWEVLPLPPEVPPGRYFLWRRL